MNFSNLSALLILIIPAAVVMVGIMLFVLGLTIVTSLGLLDQEKQMAADAYMDDIRDMFGGGS